MFVPNCRQCPLPLKLMSFVLNVSKSCTLCPLALTKLIFLLNQVTQGYFSLLTHLSKNILIKKKEI
ncbi:hypothetical protein Hanom_Chr01g00078491 [Helianthus anomalus]